MARLGTAWATVDPRADPERGHNAPRATNRARVWLTRSSSHCSTAARAVSPRTLLSDGAIAPHHHPHASA